MRAALLILILLASVQCRKQYNAFPESTGNGLLVVEGLVNTDGETTLRLTRSTSLGELGVVPVTNAEVIIEGENNNTHLLEYLDSGRYFTPKISFSDNIKYRVRISIGNREYLTDYREIIETQEIDSISYKLENESVQFFLNSTNNEERQNYYKYDYEETWQFNSRFLTILRYAVSGEGDNRQVSVAYYDSVNHSANKSIYTCWQSGKSTNISLATTGDLTSSKIFLPVRELKRDSWQLSTFYSLLVKMQGLSAEGYDFFRRMKKNSESVGSIFDAQPSDISGNILCVTNPEEVVVGFIEFSPLKEKRVFVNSADFPGTTYNDSCEIYRGEDARFPYPFLLDNTVMNYVYDSLDLLPISLYEPMPDIKYVIMEEERCVDCTLRGTNIKPSFWP